MALAWTYRRDYSAAIFPIPAVNEPVRRVGGGLFPHDTLLLVLATLLPVGLGLDTLWYARPRRRLGTWFLWRAAVFPAPGRPRPRRPQALPRLHCLPARSCLARSSPTG